MPQASSYRAFNRATDISHRVTCGCCGLVFEEVTRVAQEPHRLSGTCPRCGETSDLGPRYDPTTKKTETLE